LEILNQFSRSFLEMREFNSLNNFFKVYLTF